MYKYTVEKINDHFYRLVDCCKVACYLVIGKDKAALLDTCDGLGDLKSAVEELTDLPITVILTHGHLDHVGSAGQFNDVWMNRKDDVVYPKNTEEDIQVHLGFAKMNAEEEVKAGDFIPYYEGEIHNIEDNQIFDLGGIHIEMIPVPGHTPGMMCPLIIEDRNIIFGDACGVAVMLLNEHSSCVSEYRESLIRLKSIESQYDYIYRNHGSFWSPKDLLDNVIECCDLVLEHKDAHIPVSMNGLSGFMAKQAKPGTTTTIDGKEGNLFYIEEKVK